MSNREPVTDDTVRITLETAATAVELVGDVCSGYGRRLRLAPYRGGSIVDSTDHALALVIEVIEVLVALREKRFSLDNVRDMFVENYVMPAEKACRDTLRSLCDYTDLLVEHGLPQPCRPGATYPC